MPLHSCFTWYAISYPILKLVSSLTLYANDIAANLLGYVMAMAPNSVNPASCKNYGIWVLLPQPVSPDMSVMRLPLIASTISLSCEQIGNCILYWLIASSLWILQLWNLLTSYNRAS